VSGIFISYRREDSGGHAGRLSDRLTARFGANRVFLDVQDIRPGDNFATSIEDTIATCDCVIAVIGPRWLETIRQRAGSADDFVRHEIGAALKRRVRVIPVLMGGGRMPATRDLPPEVAELSHVNAIEIRDERFDQDVGELESFLAGAMPTSSGSVKPRLRSFARPLAIAIAVASVAAAIAGYFLVRPAGKPAVEAVAPATPAPQALDGGWVAEMQKPGQRPFRIRLNFQSLDDSLAGTVQYPTGDGAMRDVTLNGRTLTFYTTHVPQFASEPATIRFQVEIGGEQLRLLVTDDGGVATGVASRAPARD
jgi:TIR domain